MKIYDALGNERDEAWLRAKYGNVQVHPADAPGPAWRLYAVVEDADYGEHAEAKIPGWFPRPLATAALIAKTVDEAGEPQQGVPLARYWPDAPELPRERRHWQKHGVLGYTNVDGDVGFGMGGGDYYTPPAQEGASWIWIAQPGLNSDAISGLGMLAGTNHSHLNAIFQWTPAPEPPPEPPPADDDVLTVLKDIRDDVRLIREYLYPDEDPAANRPVGAR